MKDNTALLKNLQNPQSPVDVILDTDAYNEIDDQFAIAYMLRNFDKLRVKAINAAPFFNEKSCSPEDGMEKSYGEILKILSLMKRDDLVTLVHKGSKHFLSDEQTPELSSASTNIVSLAEQHNSDNPLYVVAIGAITNVASALLINPEIADKIVIVWLGGHAHHWHDTKEFNMHQDVAAARVVFNSGAPVVQLPCLGVVSAFTISEAELTHWLAGKNDICDYLVQNTITAASAYAYGKPWSRVIWDVTAVAWLVDGRFFEQSIEKCPMLGYDGHYLRGRTQNIIQYVYHIHRDALISDLFEKLSNG